MENTDPETWKCPNDWHPHCDGEWEISVLKKLGGLILKANSEYDVAINIDDFTALYFEVLKNNKKLAEIYVNRAEVDSEEPMFSVFYGNPEEELHTSDYGKIIEKLNKTTRIWKE